MPSLRLSDLATKQALQSIKWLAEAMSSMHPGCEDTQKVIEKVGDADRALVDEWHEFMSAPLNPKTAKYAQPVSRIIGAPCTRYIACEYRDCDGLLDDATFWLFDELHFAARYPSIEDSATRAELWQLIQSINRSAQEAHSEPPPRVPSRDEIRDNIREHKLSKSSATPSMHKAFQAAALGICDELEGADEAIAKSMRERVESLSDASMKKVCADWGEHSDAIDRAIASASAEQLEALPFFEPDEARAICRQLPANARIGELLKQMSSYCCVANNIPSSLMSRIEQYSRRLADDINSGNQSLETLDLSKIGEEVLQGVDSTDVDALASNIGNLLPTLTTLKDSIGHA